MMKKNLVWILMLLMLVSNVFAYNEFPDIVSRWDLDDSNADGLVNETDGIVDTYLLNNGTLYGKTFNHGTNNGATYANHTGDMEKFGGYYEFDGDSDYVETEDIDLNNFSIGLFINPYKISSDNYLISKADLSSYSNDAYDFYISNGKLRLILQTGSTSTQQNMFESFDSIDLNEYTNVYVTVSDEIKFYIDGVESSCNKISGLYECNSFSGTINDNSLKTTIGASVGGNYNRFNGSIDEVKIWNRALTQTEIQEEMSSNAVANPEGIVAYYDFNERSGTTVYDNNHLTTGARQNINSIDDPVFSWDKAMSFDGVNDYVLTENSTSTNFSEFTWSAWYNSKGSTKSQRIMSTVQGGKPLGFIQLRTDESLRVALVDNDTDANTYIYGTTLNNWHHVVATNENNVLCLYYDTSKTCSDSSTFDGDSIHIDSLYISGYFSGERFNGSIADVRIYDRALSEAEIVTLYEGALLEENGATVTPTNQSFTTEEGTVIEFEVESSWSNTVKWYLDGILQAIGNSWTWFVGVQDADNDPEKQVIALAENDTESETYVWDVTVEQAFPLEVQSITPTSGVYDSNIPINCFINDSKYWFKDSLFDFQVYYDGAWHNSSLNSSSAHHKAYVLHVTDQSDVQVRCRSFDGVYYSNWTNTAMNLTISHKKNKLELFDLSGVRRKTPYTQTAYNSHCKIDSNINSEYISNIYIDCENDGLWDGMVKHNASAQVKEDSLFSICTFPEEKIYEVSTGCIVQKTNTTKNWETPFCRGLADDKEYCNYNKNYLVTVVGTNQ